MHAAAHLAEQPPATAPLHLTRLGLQPMRPGGQAGLALVGDQGQQGRARAEGRGGVIGQRGQGHVQKLDEMIEECFVVW